MRKKNESSRRWVDPAKMWHCVVNEAGAILAVFGSGMLSAAQEECRKAEHQTGLTVNLEPLYGSRPRVGQRFPNRRIYPKNKS